MKLSELIIDCALKTPFDTQTGSSFDPDISNISSNSKNIVEGGLFIASKGLDGDGHDYIENAFKNGAAAAIAQSNPKNLEHVILVKDSRLDTATIAAQFYGHPSRDMTIVGITGTNGKTTITWLMENIFKACGHVGGVIGTVNIRYKDEVIDNPYTTPDAIYLQKILNKMKAAGVTHVAMEVSSHGLELNRVDHCRFDAGIFTNLSQDHLDFHKNMDEYFSAKRKLFTHFLGKKFNPNAPAVINIDDTKGKTLYSSLSCRTIGVSTNEKTDVYARNIQNTMQGISGTICFEGQPVSFSSQLTGGFNLENILCAAGAAYGLGISPQTIKIGIENCKIIPGRLEKIDNTIERHLFVDYAHTPDALESVLETLKPSALKRIITVFGCGGDRDAKKRPLMGQAACKHSDIAIITSDNPRSEHPNSIIEDILDGLDSFEKLSENDLKQTPLKKGYLVEADRRQAIQKAIDISKPGDTVLVAGKGHETYQITNQGTIHFDDKEALQAAAGRLIENFKPMAWTPADLADALGLNAAVSNLKEQFLFSGISTDSRTILSSQLFVALRGENFDAHAFVPAIAQKGIKGFVVQKGFLNGLDKNTKSELTKMPILIFETSDTLTALGDLARFQRLRSNAKVLAITGSSGKTTTRKVLQQIFNTRFNTLATTGNLNNEIGLPLTLLNLSIAHEWAVVEMGMNHAGEISRLTRIALPDIAMVINTAGVHLEGLGTVENVAKAKAEIFEGLGEDSTAIIFADDERRNILEEKARKNNHIKQFIFFGSDPEADICLSSIIRGEQSTDFKAEIENEISSFLVPSPARFMVNNCLAAISAARAAGIDIPCIQKGVQAFTPVSGRLNIQRLARDINLIDDTYNANPASMTQALNTLKDLSKGIESIAVVGDMLELGETSGQLHEDIGRKAAELNISRLFVFGPMGKHVEKGAMENGFPKENIFSGAKEEIAQKIAQTAKKDSWVLVKGSRGMAMETVIQELKKILTLHS